MTLNTTNAKTRGAVHLTYVTSALKHEKCVNYETRYEGSLEEHFSTHLLNALNTTTHQTMGVLHLTYVTAA